MEKLHKKSYHREKTHSTTAQVLKAYWAVVRSHRVAGVFILAAAVIAELSSIFTPIFYKQFFDVLTHSNGSAETVPILIKIIIYIAAINSVAWIFFRAMGFVNNSFQSKMMADLKTQSFDYMLDHSYTFFANRFTGSLVQRINRFARAFERFANRIIFSIVPLLVRIVGMSIVLWYIKPAITFIIIVITAVFFIFNYYFTRWKLKYEIERAEADSFSTAVLSDAIANHNTIQLFDGAKDESRYFKNVADEQARITRFAWNLNHVPDATQAFLFIAAEFFLFYFSIKYWQAGIFTVGTFVLIQAYLIGLGGRMWDLSHVMRDFYESFADAKEMIDIMILPQEIVDNPKALPLEIKKGEVKFENVAFSFGKRRNILQGFNLSVQGGEKVAFIGPSGAGKTTIVRLIMRLYDVEGGRIMIDGQDLRGLTLASLRASIALVPQDPILFHRTLLENIRYGRRSATDDEVRRAGALSHCDEFIAGLPYGYETYVGERGIKLSGGERQRIAIARAILKNAPILVLDEATSSLDSHSESLIQDALDKLMLGKTAIVIAHRLSTIRKMDRIIVLDKGAVVEEGTHQNLSVREGGLYNKLWTLQAGGFLRGDTIKDESGDIAEDAADGEDSDIDPLEEEYEEKEAK